MRIIKCDRCGAEIPNTQDSIGFIGITLKDVHTGDLVEDNPFEDWDLCDDCMKAIHQFITEPKAQAKKEKHEQILDSVDAGKKAEKKEPKKAPKPFDASGAQALRDQGWTLEKIANEMKVSIATVAKYTHPGPEKPKPKPLEWAEHEPDLDPVIKATAEAKPFKVPEEG